MADKNSMFAFVVGEVAPEFFGRMDLAKYPLGMSEVENFFVDYKGGLINRAGTEQVAFVKNEYHRMYRFKGQNDDYTIFLTAGRIRFIRQGGFILTGNTSTVTANGSGVITGGHNGAGSMVYAHGYGYFYVEVINGTQYRLRNAFGQVITGEFEWTQVYEVNNEFTDALLKKMHFYQDLGSLIISNREIQQKRLTYYNDNDWRLTDNAQVIPPKPTGLNGAASAGGDASVSFKVTAVVDGVESEPSDAFNLNGIINYTATAGFVNLSWNAVAGASHYIVYRTLVFPNNPIPTGQAYGYMTMVTSTSVRDMNITLDFTKGPPTIENYFRDANYPGLYARFQQRGIYAGMAKEPLSVCASISMARDVFYTGTPLADSDSFHYTLDAESLRPIKHMLPLRYGLMLFTDDVVAQLRAGGDSRAITANNAFAETQSYGSVSDMQPIAVNLDLMYMSQLNTEFNVMKYTAYTNSFETQDLLVLSSHLFGPTNKAVRCEWSAEPHKVMHLVREDGQRIAFTYERNQEVYGWSRYRTQGLYRDICVVVEDQYNRPYITVERTLADNVTVLSIEREMPRDVMGYNKNWFVDCGMHRPLVDGNKTIHLASYGEEKDRFRIFDVIEDLQIDDRIYIRNKMFMVLDIVDNNAIIQAMEPIDFEKLYEGRYITVQPEAWEWGWPIYSISGLECFEGMEVSVQVDGDSYTNMRVVDGIVSFPNPGVRVVVGLQYKSRAKTLPLMLQNTILDGRPIALRQLTMRNSYTRGLKVGASYDTLEEVPAFTGSDWGNPVEKINGIFSVDLLGGVGYDLTAEICFEQEYPLPASLLGLSFDIDVGGD